jgi:uncharacterized protein
MESDYPNPQTPPETSAPAPLFNRFLERGRVGKNEWWRYAVGVIISFGGYLLFSVPILLVMSAALLKKGIINEQEMREKMTNPEFLGLDANVLLVLLLLSFAGAMIGLWIAVKFLHKKPFASVITFAEKIRWKRVGFAALTWFLFSGLWIAFAMIKDPGNLRFTFEAGPFLGSLIIAILFLPAQTWWEEFMMRGYLLQAIGQRTKTALLPVISTSVIFGLLHAGNPEVATHGFLNTMPMYILPGLLFGIIAVLDEGLEIPMGFHFANNLFGTIIITNDNSAIQAFTIWRQNSPDPMLDTLQLLQLPFFLIVFMFIYKWDFKKLYR